MNWPFGHAHRHLGLAFYLMSRYTQEPPRRSLESEQTVNGRHSYPNQTHGGEYGRSATANGAYGAEGSSSGALAMNYDTYDDSHARA